MRCSKSTLNTTVTLWTPQIKYTLDHQVTAQLAPGNSISTVLPLLVRNANWTPTYIPWSCLPDDMCAAGVSTGNGGGLHLNQYTVTMQIQTPRDDPNIHGDKALNQTAKWNEEKAPIILHRDNNPSPNPNPDPRLRSSSTGTIR